jgi:hypothetical protein
MSSAEAMIMCPLAPEDCLRELTAALRQFSVARRRCFSSQLVWGEATGLAMGFVSEPTGCAAEDLDALRGALDLADAAQRLQYYDPGAVQAESSRGCGRERHNGRIPKPSNPPNVKA